MRDPLMEGIPLVLETPATVGNPLESGELAVWVREIKLLYEIQGIEDEEWFGGGKKEEIEARWRSERDELCPPKEPKEKKVKEKKVKGEGKVKDKGKGKGKGKGKKAKDEEDEEDEECESHGEEDEE
jgi:AP endonuclease-1